MTVGAGCISIGIKRHDVIRNITAAVVGLWSAHVEDFLRNRLVLAIVPAPISI